MFLGKTVHWKVKRKTRENGDNSRTLPTLSSMLNQCLPRTKEDLQTIFKDFVPWSLPKVQRLLSSTSMNKVLTKNFPKSTNLVFTFYAVNCFHEIFFTAFLLKQDWKYFQTLDREIDLSKMKKMKHFCVICIMYVINSMTEAIWRKNVTT